MLLSDLPKKFLDANRENLKLQGIGDKTVGMPVDLSKPLPADVKDEKELQKVCEQYLTSHDYLRLTASEAIRIDEIVAKGKDPGCKGFFGHWARNERSPFMPDLPIFAFPPTRPPLMVELKAHNVWQPGQQEMVRIGFWRACWNLEDFIIMLNKWEREPAQET